MCFPKETIRKNNTQAVAEMEHSVSSTPVIYLYDVDKDVVIQEDASSYELKAAILKSDHMR